MNNLYIYLEDLRDSMKYSRDIYFLTEQEESRLLDKFNNKWAFLKAVQEVNTNYHLTDSDKEYVDSHICFIDEFAFVCFSTTEGSLQMYYLLVFLKLRYPILEDRIDKILEKMVI